MPGGLRGQGGRFWTTNLRSYWVKPFNSVWVEGVGPWWQKTYKKAFIEGSIDFKIPTILNILFFLLSLPGGEINSY